MLKRQSGFTAIELLIIVVVITLLGLLGRTFYARSNSTKPKLSSPPGPTLSTEKLDNLLYANFDGLAVKLNSYDLASGSKKQLLEQPVTEPQTRSRLSTLVDAKVSTDRQLVAYRFGDTGKVTLLHNDGSALGDIARTNVHSFAWLNGKQQLILEVSNFVNCTGVNCEAPVQGFASDWYLYDVATSKETKLDTGKNVFNQLAAQSARTLYFISNSPYGGIPSKLYAYNTDSQKVSTIKLPGGDSSLGFAQGSPSGERAIVSVLSPDYGTDYRCVIYELNGANLGSKLVDDATYQCESAYWVNDSEFYFDKSTGPNGNISTSNTSVSGYYALLSVYGYSFTDKKQEKLLVSDGSEVYRLLDSLPDGSFVVSNEATKRDPHYKLEVRNSDGSLKTQINSSDKEMLFVGAVK